MLARQRYLGAQRAHRAAEQAMVEAQQTYEGLRSLTEPEVVERFDRTYGAALGEKSQEVSDAAPPLSAEDTGYLPGPAEDGPDAAPVPEGSARGEHHPAT